MDRQEILVAMTKAIRDETGNANARIDLNTRAQDVPGWDSLAHIRIIMTAEALLGCRISVDQTYEADNVGDLVSQVMESNQRR
jgi:acyl carrier protein